MKNSIALAVIAALVCAALPVIAAKKPTPRLSMAQARVIALKRAPGRIKDAEYELEKGAWRYSFDIVQDGRIHEIGVNAMSGAIVEDTFESAADKD